MPADAWSRSETPLRVSCAIGRVATSLRGIRVEYYPTGVDPSEPEVDRYTTELRDTMERKDIPYVEDMLEMAQLEGVQFLACKTSADLFELGPEDFIDGVEIMLAADFMKKATGSDLHLMF